MAREAWGASPDTMLVTLDIGALEGTRLMARPIETGLRRLDQHEVHADHADHADHDEEERDW
ncbi:MAG: hypothetical protein ABI658_28270 [Acidimicrobiales bacterium]